MSEESEPKRSLPEFLKHLRGDGIKTVADDLRAAGEIERMTKQNNHLHAKATTHEDNLSDAEYRIERLQSRVEALEGALDKAVVAIRTLPDGALGYGSATDEHEIPYQWPFRDELLSELEAKLKENDGG